MTLEQLKTHLGYLLLIVVALVASWIAFNAWRSEHDQRLVAQFKEAADQQTIKTYETQISDLKNGIAQRDAIAAANISALQKALAAVKTPQQAIAELPKIEIHPLNITPAPTSTTRVEVDALALYQTENECKQNIEALTACKADSKDKDDIIQKKDGELKAKDDTIKAIKSPGFWVRLKNDVKFFGAGAAAAAIAIAVHGGF